MPAPGKPNKEGNIGGPVFSLNGRFIYVSVAYGGDSTPTYRVDSVTGRYNEVFPAGGTFGIFRMGRYSGDFLVSMHTQLYSGQGDDDGYGGYPLFVLDPEGHVLRYIGGSKDWEDKRLRRWLKGQGWEVSWAGQLVP